MRVLTVQFGHEAGLSAEEVTAKVGGLLETLVKRFREHEAEVTAKVVRHLENKFVVEIEILSDPQGVFSDYAPP
jgi:hypothetical protein